MWLIDHPFQLFHVCIFYYDIYDIHDIHPIFNRLEDCRSMTEP